MTEKRFTYDDFEDCIIDNLTDKTHWGLDDILNDKLNEISDENEQLKERNNRQYKQLNQLYTLIEAEDWETLKQMNNKLKEAEEQLQKEWECY